MHSKFVGAVLSLAAAVITLPAAAQAPLIRMGQLIGTGAVVEMFAPLSVSQRFYRVRQVR